MCEVSKSTLLKLLQSYRFSDSPPIVKILHAGDTSFALFRINARK